MDLHDVFAESRALGFLGPGDFVQHIEHAKRFMPPLPDGAFRAIDLGSGGGLPGLVLATEYPEAGWRLIDANRRRCQFLRSACRNLGLENTEVFEGRAEDLARRADLRYWADVVVSRSFGRPAITAECATGFLAPGGRLIVSEPPEADSRWDNAALSQLGMQVISIDLVAVIGQTELCSGKWPRPNGTPARRPLF